MSVNTPLHAIDAMRRFELRKMSDDGEGYLGLDAEVFAWLLDDAERLNKLESRAMALGYEDLESLLDAQPTKGDASGRQPDKPPFDWKARLEACDKLFLQEG